MELSRATLDGRVRLLRLRDAAQYLSLSPWKLRFIVQSGQLPVVRYGENAPDRWLRLAAIQGDAEAQFWPGAGYERG